MDSLLGRAQSLAALLERMIVLYERCFEILDRERELLIRVDFERVLEIVQEKDEVVNAIRALDKDRLKIQDAFALVMDIRAEEMTLRLLGESLLAQGPDAELVGKRLLRLRQQLQSQIQALTEKIKDNKVFIERSIRNLQDVAADLSQALRGQSSAQKKSQTSSLTYTGKAKVQQGAPVTGNIVEKRF